MRTPLCAALAVLLALVLVPLTGCTSLLGDFTSGSGTGDGGGGDATMEGGEGDGGAPDAPASDAPAGDAAKCDPTSCPTGCCDSSGRCVAYAMQSGSACGTGGSACASCGASESCSNGACSCGGTMCNGCCNSSKNCVTPTTNMACGANGAQCQTCASDQECNAQGQCVCDSHTCPNGCCNSSGHCVTTTTNAACGTGGAACTACTSGQTCSNGKCTCDSTTCPQGCCTASGSCEAYSAQSSSSCGTNGSACGACANGQACSNGSCTCGGGVCNGCCGSTGQCMSSSNGSCGLNGTMCQSCGQGQECNSQGKCVCDATSCPTGCCNSSGQCVTPGPTACGTGGAACNACGGGQTCDTTTGMCVCNASSCPTGCCAGGPTGTCEAYAAQSGSSCGTGGATCAACGANQECDKNSGQCVCDGNTCASGCCTAKVGGSCTAYGSESASQCGSAGAVCTSCSNGLCDKTNGTCSCDSNTCGGCCTSPTGTCQTGNSVTSCGSGGNTCVACNGPPNSTATCTGTGVCSYACNGGYQMCNGQCVVLASDPNNCGSCGHGCLGGQCSSGSCLPYVVAQPPTTSSPLYIASDGTNIVWVDGGRSGAFQIPIQGGLVTTLQSGVSSLYAPAAIAVANGRYAFTQPINGPNFYLWWGNLGVTNGATQGTTWNPGTPHGLALTPDGVNAGFVELLGSSDASAYVYAYGGGAPVDSPACSGQGCPMLAGTQTTATSTYFAWTINRLNCINCGEVGLYNYSTKVTTHPTTSVLYPDWPVLDSQYLYWVDNASLQIWRMLLPSGAPQLVMDNGVYTLGGLAEDGTYAYFTYASGSQTPGVYYVSVSGTGVPATLRQGGSPQQVIAAGGGIFWIDTSTNDIMGMRFP